MIANPIFSSEDSDLLKIHWTLDKPGYAYRCAKGIDGFWRTVRAHRLVFHRTHGWLPDEVDHEDTNPLNCRRDNLRPASRSQQLQNRGKNKNKFGQYKGAYWRKDTKRWCSRIEIGGKVTGLGCFDSEEAAARAYDAAAVRLFGSFARGNFI